MSSAFLWIILPIVIGVALVFYRRPDNLPLYVAVALSFFLTWVAWQIPIDTVLQLGPFSLEISPTLVLFGRNFTLADGDRSLLAFIYVIFSFWLLGSLLAKPGRLFVPISLTAIGLFVAALSVEPFLYAALLIAAVVLIFIPLLAPPGKAAGRGVQRFITFQLFAVPFILFTGWLLTGVEASPGNLNLVLRAGVLLALGFSFLLGLFPFHSWVPMLAKETHPYLFGFLIFFLPSIASIFSLSFFDRYIWLRDNASVHQVLLLAGSLTVLLGGLWAATERHLGRIFAYASMLAVGGLLQAIGLGGGLGVQTLFALLLPQAWAVWLLAVSLSVFWQEVPALELDHLQKSFKAHPLLTVIFLAALLSIAGVPLVGAFAAHLSIWSGLAQHSVLALGASLLGSLGLLGAGVRILLVWLGPALAAPVAPLRKNEIGEAIEPLHDFANPLVWAVATIATITLLGYGLLPHLFLGSISRLAAMFPLLFP